MIEIWVCEDGHESGYGLEPKIKKCSHIIKWLPEPVVCLKPIEKDRTILYMKTEES